MRNLELIPWKGGACPVNPEQEITVKLRNGSIHRYKAKVFSWGHLNNNPYDIVAYKAIKPARRLTGFQVAVRVQAFVSILITLWVLWSMTQSVFEENVGKALIDLIFVAAGFSVSYLHRTLIADVRRGGEA